MQITSSISQMEAISFWNESLKIVIGKDLVNPDMWLYLCWRYLEDIILFRDITA